MLTILSFLNHAHNFSLFTQIFLNFLQCFWFSVCSFCTFLSEFIHFIFFGAIMNHILKNSVSSCQCIEVKYFCILLLYSASLPTSLNKPNSFFVDGYQIFCIDYLFSFRSYLDTTFLFFLFMVSSAVLNRSHERGHLYFVPDVRGNVQNDVAFLNV